MRYDSLLPPPFSVEISERFYRLLLHGAVRHNSPLEARLLAAERVERPMTEGRHRVRYAFAGSLLEAAALRLLAMGCAPTVLPSIEVGLRRARRDPGVRAVRAR